MVGLSTEPETTRILLGDTGLEVAGLPTTRLGLPYFDTSMPANITAQVYSRQITIKAGDLLTSFHVVLGITLSC